MAKTLRPDFKYLMKTTTPSEVKPRRKFYFKYVLLWNVRTLTRKSLPGTNSLVAQGQLMSMNDLSIVKLIQCYKHREGSHSQITYKIWLII
ncbi:hypothetical protein AWZ03_013450 [Drosophila navojoa]|uniref:Uncharacterized protein n=1 Tax=Drosophila navojoa TaxID=7232 RepID=A0A484AU34_DRONA|nr:hypothetical protein AWZ03_013450 [Drosophila navojoa]